MNQSLAGIGWVDQTSLSMRVRSELAQLLSETGFVVERVTYVNMLPGLVRSLAGRFYHAQTRENTPGRVMRVPPAWINSLQKLVMRWEAWYLARPGRTLPYGHSLICLANKPPPGATGRT